MKSLQTFSVVAMLVWAMPALGEGASGIDAKAKFEQSRTDLAMCFGRHVELSAKSDLSDAEAAGFVVDACRGVLSEQNMWRCTSGLNGTDPVFASIFAGSSDAQSQCQRVFDDSGADSIRVQALTAILQIRYE